jgi:hypothetical protein
MGRIYRTPSDLDASEIRLLYEAFDAPVTALDCGQMCAPHNPAGEPFCCDICQAVPAAYHSEWSYLAASTDLWHAWEPDDCPGGPAAQARLRAETPASMTLLACLGPAHCQRQFRLLSCRQFPFFPYVTSDYRFLGLAGEPAFEGTCWVLRNLGQVTETFRRQFIATYDRLFALFDEEFENYARHSEEVRKVFAGERRRIPLLHRNGGDYRISPGSEKVERIRFTEARTSFP